MKQFLIILSVLVFSTAYAQEHKAEFKIINSSYSKDVNDQIEFANITQDGTQYYLTEGKIAFDNDGNCLQSITKKEEVKESKIAALVSKQKSDLGLSQEGITPVFYIQFQGADAVGRSQDIATKIDNLFMSKGFGQTYGLSEGDGVSNVEFETTQKEQALTSIMNILQAEKLLQHCIIGQRVYLDGDDYNYHIFYPIGFEGVVNPY